MRGASAQKPLQMSLDVFACKDRDEMFDPGLFQQGGNLMVVEGSHEIEGRVAGVRERNESRFNGRAR